ncbi:MAG: CUB protein, partial [Psychroserpens sp.]
MKKSAILIVITLFYISPYFAQQEASFWYFGRNAGLQFNAGTGTVNAVTDGQINTLEGCTSISDATGNLLFYTDGQTVWNQNHQIMQNGDYFAGTGLLGDPSSTSSGLIVPKPQDPTKYYIFTVDEPHHQNAAVFPNQFTGVYDNGGGSVPNQDDGFNNGFAYSLVDINLDGGLGDVVDTEKNVPLITYDTTNPLEEAYKCSEKITAVKADDCSSFWVITHFTDKFYAFKVDINGVQTTPVISTVGPEVPIAGYRRNALGYLKASPDGTKLAVAHLGFGLVTGGDAPGGVYLFDFDNDTGIVSNSIELYGPDRGDSPYGVEFSSENKKVYASINLGAGSGPSSDLYQWDLESADIPNSLILIHSSNSLNAGALQLGLDKRIYRAQFSSGSNLERYLGVIDNPETTGVGAGYDENGILLDINGSFQNLSQIGLPPFIQSLFNSQIDIIQNGISTTDLKLCAGDSYTLMAEEVIGGTYTWSKNGTILSETTFELFIDEPGFYEVFIEPNNGECPIEGEAVVGIFDIPVATQPANLEVCETTEFSSFDLTTQDADILDGQDASQYEVHYFTSQENADNNINEIIGNFNNTETPQTVYARVDNIDNENCYTTTSFQVSVFVIPIINSLNDITVCDDSVSGSNMDGLTTTVLTDLDAEILGNQDPTLFTISYHPTQDDADNNTDAHADTYNNTEANSEEVFVRIENNNNADCYTTSSFFIIVNNVPVANDTTLLQCDEDGIPEGFTTFDLTQIFDEITGEESNREINFYVSLSDLEADEDEINAEAFENYFDPHIIYALVTDTLSGCSNIAEITLEASSTASNNTVLEACDDDGIEDGFYNFDLNDTLDAILFGLPNGLEISFYETYEASLLEDNELNTNYTNSIPYDQIIYARVENMNACFGISEIQLTVFELP